MRKAKFELKQEHIDLIPDLNFKGLVSNDGGDIEYRPTIDYKRPFGNSGVTYDVLQRLGLTDDNGNYTDADRKRAEQLIIELPVALEIIVRNKTFDLGEYEVEEYSSAYFVYKGQHNLHFWQDAIKRFKETFCDTEQLVNMCMNHFDENPYSFLKELRGLQTNNYMEKALEIFEKYAVEKWIGDNDVYCQYCTLDDECPHGMTCYGGEPIEPACCGGIERILDTETLLDDLINGET